MFKSRVLLAGALAISSVGVAHADGSLTVTPAVVSDYDLRGISQTAKDPAFQLGATYTHDSGFYVSGWASNLNFGLGNKDPDGELDLVGGYAWGDAKGKGAFDAGVIYYTYVGRSDFDYPEVYLGYTKDWFNAKAFYSWDFGGTGSTAWYLTTTGTFPLPSDFALVAHAGYSTGDYWDKNYGGGYVDWSVGVTKAIGKFTVGLSFIDGSDLKDTPGKYFDTRSKVVASVSTTLPWGKD
ncbi:MAG: hypothetical protein RLZZ393_1441 [Pseudomonadota bacterium]|jgi:uncharacterized protein (TIGR02001 family)